MDNKQIIHLIKNIKNPRELINFFENNRRLYSMNTNPLSTELNRILIERHISQHQLSKQSGEDKTYISRLCSGKIESPNKYRLLRICIAVELSLDETVSLLTNANCSINPKDVMDSVLIYALDKRLNIIEAYELLTLCASLNLINKKRLIEFYPDVD